MSSGKLTGTTETCTVSLPGCRDEARISWVSAEEAFRFSAMVSFGMAHHSEPTRQDGATVAFTLCGLAGLLKNPAEGGRQSDRRTSLTATAPV